MGSVPFYSLPYEMYLEIGSNLEAFDLAALIQTCSRCHDFLQDMLYDVALTHTLKLGDPYNGKTVLQWAAWKPKQRKSTLAALVGKGADIYVQGLAGTLLHNVAALGDEDATRLLVRSGIHPWTIAYSNPPLVHASGGGYETIVRYLLYDALDMWQRDAPQRTTTCEKWDQFADPWNEARRPQALLEAFHRAAEGGHLKVAELLCQHIDISQCCLRACRLTDSASRGGSTEIMHMLLELGAELHPSALHIAVDQGHVAIVQDILSRRPTYVSDVDYAGWTPLHFAAFNGQADIVQALLHHGADHNVVNELNDTALDLAICHRHDNVTRILAELPISAPTLTYDDPYDSDW